MKTRQHYLLALLVILFISAAGFFLLYRTADPANKQDLLTEDAGIITMTPFLPQAGSPNGAEEEDGIREAQEFEFRKTYDQRLGYVPRYKLALAQQDILRKIAENGAQRTSAFTWTERGPNTDQVGPSNGNGRVSANQVTAGRLRTIWVDLADGTNQTVWLGGVDGGVWRTTNMATDPTSWTLMTDVTANIAIASITQSPVNTNHMYFGTGEKSANVDAVRGGGVWKSTDHGVNWTLLGSTVNFWNVSKVICDPSDVNIIYVATMGNGFGLQRSIDGGASWTNITPTGLNTAVTEMELSSTGRLHIVCGYAGGYFSPLPSGYRYTDAPASVNSGGWISPAVGFTSTDYNADLAVVGNTLYALPASSGYQTNQVWKSTNGGANWAVTPTTPPTGGSTPVSSGQAWYNLAIGADPTNADNVMVGGLNSYISTNGGTTWSPNSVWVTGVPGSGNYIHADHHIIVWNNNQVLDGGDGGIFYSGDDGVTWSDRNVGLRLKQFYSVAIHPTSTNYFLGGAQDNGCHQLNNAGMGGSVEVTGGDGAFMHIDQDEPQYQFGSYVYNNYRRSTNSGANWSSVNFGNNGQFINPTDYDDIVNKMYCGWTAGNYFLWDNPQTGATSFTVNVPAFNASSVMFTGVSPHTVNRVFFGTAGGRVVRVDNANGVGTITGTNITGSSMPGAAVSCVAIGTNDNNLLATYSNYGLPTNRVWVSTVGGGGAGWTNITGDLPDIPVRWAMFFPDDNTKAILATDLGIFETALINGASTIWVQDPVFPKVRVDMLQYRRADGLLAAGTHGRGIWTAPIPFTQPYVHFAFNYNYRTEATGSTSGCRNYTDYTVEMRIDQAPTGAATVTLTPAGGSTATQGVDYDFTTNGNFTTPSNTVTFANGSTTPVTITFRIYNDSELESLTEFVTLNYSIGGGTNALASPGSPSYTFTIVENDAAPVSGTNAIATAFATTRTEQVGNNGTYYFYSGTNIISSLSGASLSLGCVTASIFEAGNTWQTFQGGQRSQKVFDVAPTTNPGATYTIGLYFTNTELGAETANGLRIAKTTAATMAGANSSNTVIMVTPNPVAYGTGYVYTVSFTGFSKFFLVDPGVVLPVQLISFTGRLDNRQVQLNWKTSAEENSKEFIVEKSADGISFRPITRVPAAGNSFIEQNYQAIDREVDEFNYYRLRMVDQDAHFDYSRVILIRDPAAQQDLRIGNNPFGTYIDLRFAKLPRQPVQLELRSMNGSLIYKRTYSPANQFRMDLSGLNLSRGAYLLTAWIDERQFTRKLLKQ